MAEKTQRTIIDRLRNGLSDAFRDHEEVSEDGFMLVPVTGFGESEGEHNIVFVSDYDDASITLVSAPGDVFVNGVLLKPYNRAELCRNYAEILVREDEGEDGELVLGIQLKDRDFTKTLYLKSGVDGRRHFRSYVIVDRIVSLDPEEEITVHAEVFPDRDSAVVAECIKSGICSVSTSGSDIKIIGVKSGATTVTVYPEDCPDNRAEITVFVRETCELQIDGTYDYDGNLTELSMEMKSEESFSYNAGFMLYYKTNMESDCIPINDGYNIRNFDSNKRVVIERAPERMKRCRDLFMKKKVSLDLAFLDFDRNRYHVQIRKNYLNDRRWWRDLDVLKED